MPEPENPSTTNEPTSNPSSSAPISGSPEPWKAPAHSTFAGRSAEEILGIAEASANMLQRFNQPIPQPAPQPSRFDLDMPDDEYLTGRHVKGILQQFANQPAQIDHVGRQQAASALLAAVKQLRADDFRRWGPEITSELTRLDPSHWTLDNLEIIINIVKSRHIDELAAEKAQRLVNESHPTIRSGTGGSAGGPLTQQVSLEADGVPKAWATAAKAAGIGEAEVREFCAMTGQTPEQYMAELQKFGKGAVIRG